MKAMILQYLSELIDSEDNAERQRLKSKLVELISLSRLDLDEEKEIQAKRLIIATIKTYADTSDNALKLALQEHYKTLNLLLYNYC